MKNYHVVITTILLSFVLVSCAHYPPDRYNTQKGAAIGAGTGALLGQAIGGNSKGTLIGMAAGTILGALVGNAADQDYQAARDAARYNKPVIYYDKNGRAIEAVPQESSDPNCQVVRKRIWEDGILVKETVEEVCGRPAPVARHYSPPPPRPGYYYGALAWPFFSSFHFSYRGDRGYRGPRHRHYRNRHYRHRPYRHRSRHHW